MRGNLQKNQELEVWDMFSAGKQRQGNRSRNSQQYRSKRLQNRQQPYSAQGTRNREQQYSTARTQGRKQIDSARVYDKQRRDLGKAQDRRQSHDSAKIQSEGQKYSSRRMQSRVQQPYSASGARSRGQQYVTRRQQYNSGGTQSRGRQYVVDIPQSQRYQRRESQAYRLTQNSRSATYRSKSAQIARQKKAQRRHSLIFRTIAFLLIVACLTGAFMLPGTVFEWMRKSKAQEDTVQKEETPIVMETEEVLPLKIAAPLIKVDFLEVNEYSRPGTELNEIKNIFVHYTANPKTSAKQNRSYFSNLAETHERSASAHFIIGYTGEIIQCIPMDEQAYAVVGRNEDSISIECCYIQKDGQFTQETYDSLIKLLAWLMQEYELESKDILRHYDCGGKRCPLYYVDHEDAWVKLLKDVDAYVESFETSE